jgi:hypothetical protein
VDVQVNSLGKLFQKGVQRQRPGLHGGLVGVGGAGFRRGRLSRESGRDGGKSKTGEKKGCAAHHAFQCKAGRWRRAEGFGQGKRGKISAILLKFAGRIWRGSAELLY